ncbi:hypothetical protein SASPL_155958 [Salvia splendens]|uniref:1-deoxy-D-xylulose-5-phosphate synthase n=1 Tax=Salvia splendens TaxID=180675 RepID=A0A8X8YXL5_SALSN|nr:hypothetical protein SASPL_155958 [Salvia splendens]
MASSCGVLNSSFLPLLHSDDSQPCYLALPQLSPSKSLSSSTRQHERRCCERGWFDEAENEISEFHGREADADFGYHQLSNSHEKLSIEELERLADELREEIVYSVSKTGGHLSSSLGLSAQDPHREEVQNAHHSTNFGLAGFPKRDESAHDAFGAGHSSTSISAGLGMAVGEDLLHKDNHVISVIGDGAMTAGQAYEALNNAGFLDSNLIIVLNDNKQVSLPTATIDGPAPPVGALSKALTRLQASRKFRQLREAAKGVTKQMGEQAHEIASKVDTYMKGMMGKPGASLFEARDLLHRPSPGPVLIHIITEKGKGYPPAEVAADKMHGVVKGRQQDRGDPRSNGGGTGLNYFQKRFPDRCFDVGIAEQHAVTFAAGLATEGLKPFCTIYSSFLQRGYDQVVHDVDLQKLPLELMHMIATAAAIDDRPSCVRYPRGNGVGAPLPPNNKGTPLEVGKGRILREGSRVAILGFGTIVQNCLAAAELLNEHGMSVTVADARFCKPLDGELIKKLVQEHEVLITVEEGSIGVEANGATRQVHRSRGADGSIEEAGLSPKHIAATVVSLIGGAKDSLHLINNL